MAYSFVLVPEHGYFIVTGKGVITDFDLYDFRATVLIEPGLSAATKRLYDARQVTKTTFSALLFWRILYSQSPPAGTRRAFVVSNRVFNKFAYRTAFKFSNIGRNSRIFADMDEALAWLDLNRSDVFPGEASRVEGDIP